MRGRGSRRFLVPETIQTSAMDCGPAALKSLLEGFGIPVSYGRLREACQTDVDGTSIDTLEDIAGRLGLEAEQVVLPLEHVVLPESGALPALVVIVLPNGRTHFVVVWRRVGSYVQIMDPGTGRRWISCRDFLRQIFQHQMDVPSDEWRTWAGTPEAVAAFRRRMEDLGVTHAAGLLTQALADPSFAGLAILDASMRMIQAMVDAGGLKAGDEAQALLEATIEETSSALLPAKTPGPQPASLDEALPRPYWSVFPAGAPDVLRMRCAVLVRIKGVARKEEREETSEASVDGERAAPALTPELEAALAERPSKTWRQLWDLLREDGALTGTTLLVSLVAAVLGNALVALLFRGLVDIGAGLGMVQERLVGLGAVVSVVLLLMALEVPVATETRRLGRRLELRLRMALLEKLPRLGDRYLSSRPVSDMAERAHNVHRLRRWPDLGARMVRIVMEMLVTVGGIAWIDVQSAPLAMMVGGVALAVAFLLQAQIGERDLRVRTHAGALSRFYLDALMGLVAIRTHGAEGSVKGEHEALLVEWSRASRTRLGASLAVDALQGLLGVGLAVGLLASYLGRVGDGGGALLLLYWGLRLPVAGEELALLVRQGRTLRNVAARLVEPLGALEEPREDEAERGARSVEQLAAFLNGSGGATGMGIELQHVHVRAGGHEILKDVTLSIPPGSVVAVVGPSGAGKSSLAGLLLGWHRASSGEVTVDGELLGGSTLDRLRARTAWVDPAVQLWNQPLLDNLMYGARKDPGMDVAEVLETAELRGLLEELPEGLQSTLGEGGGLLSGGEGQRVRFGRALLRERPRLVILDEPFRGLEGTRRRELLSRARRAWAGATMLCITHDIAETRAFERVVVIEDGRVVEDGAPADLEQQEGSRYRSLLMGEQGLWEGVIEWRRVRMEAGRVTERPAKMESPVAAAAGCVAA